uniref:Secreted protein n=1 Tax=Steinernema glaseri TaxID=37863 RepID=A0A1I7YZ70_9BILA
MTKFWFIIPSLTCLTFEFERKKGVLSSALTPRRRLLVRKIVSALFSPLFKGHFANTCFARAKISTLCRRPEFRSLPACYMSRRNPKSNLLNLNWMSIAGYYTC